MDRRGIAGTAASISQMGRFETAHRRHALRIDTWSDHGKPCEGTKEIAPEVNAEGRKPFFDLEDRLSGICRFNGLGNHALSTGARSSC